MSKTVAEHQTEFLCSFYDAIVRAGGDPRSFHTNMTVVELCGTLAQNGVRFTHER